MRNHSDVAKEVLLSLCETIETPYSHTVWASVMYDDDFTIINRMRQPEPWRYTKPEDFRLDYLVYNYLKKYRGFKSGIDLPKAAFQKWDEAEEQCKQTNIRLRSACLETETVGRAIQRARHKIMQVLGRFAYRKVLGGSRMGPGSTYEIKRSAPRGQKSLIPVSVTEHARHLAIAWLEHDFHWLGLKSPSDGPFTPVNCLMVVNGARWTSVPKDAKTDRSISIEPTFNIFLQKGVGRYIRMRLKAFGVDLDTQARNQEYAAKAYSEGYATIDLSSASDTVALELVRLLLPPEWFDYLDKIRSRCVEFKDGSKRYLQKFSSMGNGFTFELESLIFWALSPSSTTVVFGDDIICRREDSYAYVEILEHCGFKVNLDKSYFQGDFFESCGKHYFKDVDVTPVYQKQLIRGSGELVRAYNRLYRCMLRAYGLWIKSPESIACALVLRQYKWSKKPFIPDYFPDDRGFLTSDGNRFIATCPNKGIKCYILVAKLQPVMYIDEGCYAYKLWAPESTLDVDDDLILRQIKESTKFVVREKWLWNHC